MGALLLDEQTAPGTPSTGQVVVYPKSDGFLYSKDDAGTETQLAVSSGITLGAYTATTSGTSVSLSTSVSGAKIITVSFFGVSTNSTSPTIIQLGTTSGS